jgi:hypothetical protein
MSDTDHVRADPRRSANPVRTAAMIVYATFALLILTIPQSLISWLHDMNENPVQQILLQAAEAVQSASHGAGLDIAYRRARAGFYALTGKEDN